MKPNSLYSHAMNYSMLFSTEFPNSVKVIKKHLDFTKIVFTISSLFYLRIPVKHNIVVIL